MKEVDFILIFILILFIFYIPLCWCNENYTTNQKGGMGGTELLSNVVEKSTKALTSTIMAPLDLVAQGVNGVISTVSSIPKELEKIGKDAIDDATEPVDKVVSELSTIYTKLSALKDIVSVNDGAAKDMHKYTKDGLDAAYDTIDTIVSKVDHIVSKFNELESFITGAVGQLDITQIKEDFNSAIGSLSGGLTEVRDQLNNLGSVKITMPDDMPILGGSEYNITMTAPATTVLDGAISTLNGLKQ